MDESAASSFPKGDLPSSTPPPTAGPRPAQEPNPLSTSAIINNPQHSNPSPSPCVNNTFGVDSNKKPHATTHPATNPSSSSTISSQHDADRSSTSSTTTVGSTEPSLALVNASAHPHLPPQHAPTPTPTPTASAPADSDTDPVPPPILPPRPPPPHIRTPSAAGLSIQTNNLPPHPPLPLQATGGLQSPLTPTIVEGNVGDSVRQSASAPIAIQDGYLRGALSATSMAGSLSPGSALSSPALNALADITPLPSPLVMSDSPGPWARASISVRPRSRGASNSSRDDSFAVLSKGGLSPSPSLKKKGYQRLQTAAVEAAAAGFHTQQKSESSNRERNRSVSEFSPESLHNIRPRHVTISNLAPEQVGPDTSAEPHQQHDLHREQYLAAQRGLVPASSSSSGPVGLPTPPGSNRSVTESEEEEVPENDKIQYIAVKHGSNKKLWRPVRQLGQGTFSKVYLATSEKTAAKDPLDENTLDPRKLVAIKVVEHGPAGGADEERVELSLKREVEMLRSVSHPSLVHLRAFDKDEAQALIVLTYCPGGDLFDVASAHRNVLSVDLVQRIFAEMVSAVRYLHNQLIVHRDIKLENVLLNVPIPTVPLLKNPQSHPYPIATLTDLGLSRRIPAPPESPLLTTRCGSEDYAAPEILLGQPYDGRSTDAWALGVLLYALMEGRLPFDPPPGKVGSRSRAAHRIARCDWVWVKFGDDDGEWDAEKGKEWAGARECVEGLLKKVSRGRKSLEDIEKIEWVQQGIQVEGGLKRRIEDEDQELTIPEITIR